MSYIRFIYRYQLSLFLKLFFYYFVTDCDTEITSRGELFTNGDVSAGQYEGCTSLTHLYIGETTKHIHNNSFSSTSLKYVFGNIQKTTIHENAFNDIPDSLQLTCPNCVVEKDAFTSENITLKSSIAHIKSHGFTNEICIQNGVVMNGKIEEYAFFTDCDLHVGDLNTSLTLNVSKVTINNVLDDIIFTLNPGAKVTITGKIDGLIQSERPITIEVENICNGTEFALENIDLVCQNGAFGAFTGKGYNLEIIKGIVDDGVDISGEFDKIAIGTTGSRNIHMSGSSLDPYISAQTIYISSCINSRFDQSLYYKINTTNSKSGLNYTNNESFPVTDICTPCSTGSYFDVETETG